MAAGELAPRGLGEGETFLPAGERGLPLELVEDPVRRGGQDGREEDGDDPKGFGELVKEGVELGGAGRVFREGPRFFLVDLPVPSR